MDFDNYITKLATQNRRTHQYIMKINLDKWARSYFLENRYNIMTTNIVKCMNIVLQDARSLLVVSLLKSIQFLIQDWFSHGATQQRIILYLSHRDLMPAGHCMSHH